MLIIPTYMNKDSKGKTNRFSDVVGKAGAAIVAGIIVLLF